MRLKRLIGSHFANYKEASEANRLIAKGMIHPVMSQVFALEDTGEAAFQVHHNMRVSAVAAPASTSATLIARWSGRWRHTW